MVATAVLPLSHVPEPTVFDKVAEPDIHKTAGPLNVPGLALTVTTCVTALPPKL
jgi:hypothetical protein